MVKKAEKIRKRSPLLPVFGAIIAIGLFAVSYILSSQVVVKMPQGTPFRILQRQGAWAYVQLRDGTEGWANSAWIQCCKSATN